VSSTVKQKRKLKKKKGLGDEKEKEKLPVFPKIPAVSAI
jgi:hypothetical protein